MNDDILKYTLRVDRTLFKKFRYVADYSGRSANKQLEHYIKNAVQNFESSYEEIKLED